MTHTRLAIGTLSLLLASCANYDFSRARLPNGEYDMQRLIADLSQSSSKSLHDVTWIPLLYFRARIFQPTSLSEGLPAGYKFGDSLTVGPFSCFNDTAGRLVGSDGKPIEYSRESGVGWHLLYRHTEDLIETSHGTRREGTWRLALLFGSESKYYTPAAVAPGAVAPEAAALGVNDAAPRESAAPGCRSLTNDVRSRSPHCSDLAPGAESATRRGATRRRPSP